MSRDVVCTGRASEHCCWFRGEKCPFVLEGDDAPEGRDHACSIVLAAGGNWDAAVESYAWQAIVLPLWSASGLPKGFTCRDWPQGIPADLVLGGRCCYAGEG